MASIISVGDKVDLRIIKHKQTSNAIDKEYRIYKSKIYDIADEKILKLSMPIEGGSIVLLPLGQVFEIYFYTMNGLYQAKGKVIKRLKENNIFVFLFELSTPIKKNQRREFFRFDCVIDMKYSQVSEYESRLVLQNEIEDARGKIIEWQNGFIVDISGGGIRFTSGDKFLKNSYILAKFNLVINHRIKEFCIIIKIISSDKILNRSGQYESRGKFVSMSLLETEEIVRYIFEEERKSRKNRKS